MRLYALTPLRSAVAFSDTKSLAVVAASSQYVDMGNNINLEYNTDFTLSIWVNPTTIAGGASMMGKLKGSSPYTGYNISHTDTSGKIRFQLINTYGSNYIEVDTSAVQVSVGSWTHIAIVYNGSGGHDTSHLHLYFNGTSASFAINANSLSASTSHSDSFKIGFDGFTNYNGKLDEASVWNTNLGPSQITELYNSGTPTDLSIHSAAANLTHWWRLGDLTDSASTTFDRKGSVDGTLQGSPSYSNSVP